MAEATQGCSAQRRWNNEPAGWEIMFSYMRGKNWNQLKETERGTTSNSKEWNFPPRAFQRGLCSCFKYSGPGRPESQQGKRHRASVTGRSVTQKDHSCSATILSTFQRAPHCILQVKLENSHSETFLR